MVGKVFEMSYLYGRKGEKGRVCSRERNRERGGVRERKKRRKRKRKRKRERRRALLTVPDYSVFVGR